MTEEPDLEGEPGLRFAFGAYRDIMDAIDNSALGMAAPPRLYQYLGAEALRGILANRTLWATHCGYLNDREEVRYTLQYARDLFGVEQPPGMLADRALTEDALKSILGWYIFTLRGDGVRERGPFSPYVACFSANRDLLSQWRAYAHDGLGFALGIDAHAMMTFSRTPENEPLFVLRRVVYNRNDQAAWLHRCFDAAMKYLASACMGRTLTEVRPVLLDALIVFDLCVSALTPFFKHPAFEEEQEWRLVHNGPVAHAVTDPQHPVIGASHYDVFIAGDRVVPFRPLRIGSDSLHPFREVVVGPQRDFGSTVIALKLAFHKWRLDDLSASITKSDAPYRSLRS